MYVCEARLGKHTEACVLQWMGVAGQAGSTAEAGIIEAAVIKTILIVLIGVINVVRVRLLT